jgi:hypothetical protein
VNDFVIDMQISLKERHLAYYVVLIAGATLSIVLVTGYSIFLLQPIVTMFYSATVNAVIVAAICVCSSWALHKKYTQTE